MSDLHKPRIDNHGIVAFHDYACPVLHDRHAVFNCNTGIFEPSWEAQAQGWRLVKLPRWLNRILAALTGTP